MKSWPDAIVHKRLSITIYHVTLTFYNARLYLVEALKRSEVELFIQGSASHLYNGKVIYFR